MDEARRGMRGEFGVPEQATGRIHSVSAHVIDVADGPRGAVTLEAAFDGRGPTFVNYDGHAFWFTGRNGMDSETGEPVREMGDGRKRLVWVSLDATRIWEGSIGASATSSGPTVYDRLCKPDAARGAWSMRSDDPRA